MDVNHLPSHFCEAFQMILFKHVGPINKKMKTYIGDFVLSSYAGTTLHPIPEVLTPKEPTEWSQCKI